MAVEYTLEQLLEIDYSFGVGYLFPKSSMDFAQSCRF
jgi:hypothetical protein